MATMTQPTPLEGIASVQQEDLARREDRTPPGEIPVPTAGLPAGVSPPSPPVAASPPTVANPPADTTGETAASVARGTPTPSELSESVSGPANPALANPAPTLIGPGWGRPVRELRPLWIAQLPAVAALAPYGQARLGRLFRLLPENPDSDRLDGEFVEWAKQSGLFEDAPPGALDEIKMGHIVHWCAPEVTTPEVQWNIGIYMMWMIAMDDYWVEPGRSLIDIRRACNNVILEGEDMRPLVPESRFFIELREGLERVGGSGLFPQIADELQRLFLTNEIEQRHNKAGTLPTLMGFLQLRAKNGAVNGPTIPQRCEPGLLPPHLYYCERLATIADLASILAGLDNDILGYERDVEAEYPMNVITVISNEFRVDLATAYLMSLDLTEVLKYAMELLVADVCAYPGEHPEAVAQARALSVWPDGWHTWSFSSPRYRVEASSGATLPDAGGAPEAQQELGWRAGPLVRALTGLDRWPSDDEASAAGTWGRPFQQLIASLIGGFPMPSGVPVRAGELEQLPGESASVVASPTPSTSSIEAPPSFPSSIPVRWEAYRNWARNVESDAVWVCEPRDTADVVLLANWARNQGYRLRPAGGANNFSPLVLSDRESSGDDACERVVLVDTRAHLSGLEMASTAPAEVRSGVGVTLEALLTYLEEHGFGLATSPVIGTPTIGGLVATGTHGSSVAVPGWIYPTGYSHGSFSNLVTSFTAVVWDRDRGEYIARTFDRTHPDSGAFLVNLGRAFLTEVTLRVGSNQILRCQSDVTRPAIEVFGPPEVPSTHRFASIVQQAGRVDALWFHYQDRTWLRTWTPATGFSMSRPAATPYNYPFMDNFPPEVSDLVIQIMDGSPELAPALSEAQYANVVQGLIASASADLVGPSKNVLLFMGPNTLRYFNISYAICTRRADLQRVLHDFAKFHRELLNRYQEQGQYPVNGPTHIRVNSLDTVRDLNMPGASAPALSALAPNPDQPDWDVAVWLGMTTLPETPAANQFYGEIEEFIFSHYRPPYAMARVEWSKVWGFSEEGPYTNGDTTGTKIPSSYGDSWNQARTTLASYDPHGVFTNDFLDQLFS